MHPYQLGFIGHKDVSTYTNWSTYYSTLTKQMIKVIKLYRMQKAFNEKQSPFMIKIQWNSNRRKVPQHNEGHIWQTSANIILHGKKKTFSFKIRTRQGCPFSPLLFSIVALLLIRAIRQENEIKGISVLKEEKVSLLRRTWFCT